MKRSSSWLIPFFSLLACSADSGSPDAGEVSGGASAVPSATASVGGAGLNQTLPPTAGGGSPAAGAGETSSSAGESSSQPEGPTPGSIADLEGTVTPIPETPATLPEPEPGSAAPDEVDAGTDGPEQSDSGVSLTPGEPEVSSDECPQSALAAGNSTRQLELAGATRSFILHVPDGYSGQEAVPLVIDFHPLGGTGSQEQSSSGYQQIADREGFLVAFPDGVDNAWNIGPCCTDSRDVPDLEFAKAIVESISSDGCVDASRVYSVGFSMGGGMSHYLACNAADTFAAVAPAGFDLLVPDEQPCAPSRPISVLAFRGTNDTVVPFEGGAGGSGRVEFMGAEASFRRWVELNGCDETARVEGDCEVHTGCTDGVEVGLCTAQGGGHAPGDANVGWEFLRRFQLP